MNFTPDSDPQPLMQRLKTALRKPVVSQFLRFLIVGASATILHTSVLYVLVEYEHMLPFTATSIGFACGVTLSYILNSLFTFRTPIGLNLRFLKFLAVTGVGFLLNGLIFTSLHNLRVMYLVAQLIATGVVVFWNFFGSRLLVFLGTTPDGKPET